MEKEELKKDLKEVVAKIKTNSKDQHYADVLIDKLLSIKGQLGIEPTRLYLPMSDIIDSVESKTFRIEIFKSGEAIYHLKGGMDVIVRPNATSLYSYLTHIVALQNGHTEEEITDEMRDLIVADLEASSLVLNIPFFAFGDFEFKYKLAEMVVDYLNKLQVEEVDNAELQDPTPVEDSNFEETVRTLEEIELTNDK
jgi:hypothetical protein